MAILVLAVLLVSAALAPRYGVDSRPDFRGHPDVRHRDA